MPHNTPLRAAALLALLPQLISGQLTPPSGTPFVNFEIANIVSIANFSDHHNEGSGAHTQYIRAEYNAHFYQPRFKDRRMPINDKSDANKLIPANIARDCRVTVEYEGGRDIFPTWRKDELEDLKTHGPFPKRDLRKPGKVFIQCKPPLGPNKDKWSKKHEVHYHFRNQNGHLKFGDCASPLHTYRPTCRKEQDDKPFLDHCKSVSLEWVMDGNIVDFSSNRTLLKQGTKYSSMWMRSFCKVYTRDGVKDHTGRKPIPEVWVDNRVDLSQYFGWCKGELVATRFHERDSWSHRCFPQHLKPEPPEHLRPD